MVPALGSQGGEAPEGQHGGDGDELLTQPTQPHPPGDFPLSP